MFNWGPSWQDHPAYLAACDQAYSQLHRVCGNADFPSDGVTAICVARNEADRLPRFLDHYRRLGVRHIHVIDNASSDGTGAIAGSWSDTTVWHTDASYAQAVFGQLWIGAVVRRHGLGNWVLNVDVDEHLVYDGMERNDLNSLCSWLRSREQTRLFAPLIDIYPRLPSLAGWPAKLGRLWKAACNKLRGEDGVDSSFYFDRSDLPDSPNYRFLLRSTGMEVSGGVRARAIGGGADAFCLSKVPLALWDSNTAYCNVHFPFPFDLNPHEHHGALLHYKFVGDFQRRVSAAIRENQHWNESFEYKLYRRWLDTHSPMYSRRYSVRYRGPESLICQGLLMPIDWNESILSAPARPMSAVSGAACGH
jgi:hypothetical protein